MGFTPLQRQGFWDGINRLLERLKATEEEKKREEILGLINQRLDRAGVGNEDRLAVAKRIRELHK
jgi:hypothetical protein